MEAFNSIPGITHAKLQQTHAARLFLRVVLLADLCGVQGTHIRDGMLQGDWQAGSDFKWPFQPNPPKPSKTLLGHFRIVPQTDLLHHKLPQSAGFTPL